MGRRSACALRWMTLGAALAAGAGAVVVWLLAGESRASTPAPAETEAAAAPVDAAATVVDSCRPGEVHSLTGERIAYAARVLRPLGAFRKPGGPAIARFGRINVNGVPTVLGVLAMRVDGRCDPTWYRVQLPIRPNGAVGWIRADRVRLYEVRTRIVVDLSDRKVTLFRGAQRVLQTTAAIGKPGTPTPTGRYYVNQRLRAADPTGPFGPGAVGISAFSPTLTDWVQGGPIAIHGTNTPYKLGLAVSYGCVRIRNSELLRLFDLAAEGTPVLIRN